MTCALDLSLHTHIWADTNWVNSICRCLENENTSIDASLAVQAILSAQCLSEPIQFREIPSSLSTLVDCSSTLLKTHANCWSFDHPVDRKLDNAYLLSQSLLTFCHEAKSLMQIKSQLIPWICERLQWLETTAISERKKIGPHIQVSSFQSDKF